MSLVTKMEINFEPIFGEIGKEIQYTFNVLCILEDMLKNGINNINVVVVKGDLTDESKEKLKKYYINENAWRKEMFNYTLNNNYLHNTVLKLFTQLPLDFQQQYINKFGDPIQQIKKMQVII